MMLLSPRLWLALAIAAALAFTHTMAYRSGGDSVQVDWDKATAARATKDRDTERENTARASRQQTNVIEAVNAQTQRNQVLQADAARGRAAVDSLRSTLATARAELPTTSPDAGGQHCAAERELLDAVGAGFADLADKGAELAGKAGGHASDALTMQSAWPK